MFVLLSLLKNVVSNNSLRTKLVSAATLKRMDSPTIVNSYLLVYAITVHSSSIDVSRSQLSI